DAGYEIALCADALGTADLAWSHAERANRLAEQAAPHAFKDGQDFLLQIQGLYARFTPEWVAAWPALPAAAATPVPAFLAGFPRSGTTLLDSMLDGHPDIVVLEERATEQAMIATLNQLPGGYPEALGPLTSGQHAQVTESYFRAAALAEGDRRRVVDKSPFLTVHLGMVQRIFPGAAVIFMLRHPCDVVLSCFMTSLELNSGTVHFTRINTSVELYCKVMSLWQRYCEVLPLNMLQVRYEDLLDHPEAKLRQVLDFLGVPWSAEVLRHTEHVPGRGNIKSASYAQVSRPVYQSSRDRWQRYRKYLEPHLEQLRPWCERFGYAL
ncbi:MAG: sulfotransferase family protein, partial [Gammaproteobacteria bacterium]